MGLKTFCDSVLHAYLSNVADTTEKRNYLHVLYTAADALRPVNSLDTSLENLTHILELHPPTFQPFRNPHVLLDAWQWNVADYLGDFLCNPERSTLFHYDPGLWSAFVAARYMRYLRTSNLK